MVRLMFVIAIFIVVVSILWSVSRYYGCYHYYCLNNHNSDTSYQIPKVFKRKDMKKYSKYLFDPTGEFQSFVQKLASSSGNLFKVNSNILYLLLKLFSI